jgi:RNA polymerase sigma-70 factor, ECF subfamily
MKDPNVDTDREDSSSIGSTSSSLIEGVRANVAGAWERLTTLYGPLVYGWARHTGLQSEDAGDVVQEVFLLKNIANFQHQVCGATFRGWLWTITHNKIRDFHRRLAGRVAAAGGSDALQRLLDVPEACTSGSFEVGSAQFDMVLARALELIRSEFKDASWQAFWDVVVDGKPVAEVAARLGISVNAVYIARSRILRRLRDELNAPPR